MSPLARNPVFWLMWAILGGAVLAGLGMVAVAMQDADRALPSIYHWEGERLDADFERARAAAALGLQAQLTLADGQCRLSLRGSDVPALQLHLTSSSDARLDRVVVLTRSALDHHLGKYLGDCAPLERGRWRLSLNDAANTWALRATTEATSRIELRARAPEGPRP